MVVSILISITVNQICLAVITQTRALEGRNIITQSSTNQIHPAEIPWTSNLYVCNFTRPSFSSASEGLAPKTMTLNCGCSESLNRSLKVSLVETTINLGY